MDTKGHIYGIPEGIQSDEVDRLRSKLHEISNAEAELLKPLSKKKRLGALADLRAHPLALLPEMTDDERRQLRNVLKSERRRRRVK